MDFCGCGFSFGSLLVIIGAMLAVLVCWSTNSILISALAGVFGWFYLIYYVVIIRPREATEEGGE